MRSSSRLTRQEPFQKKDNTPSTDPDKPALTESIGTAASEPKVKKAGLWTFLPTDSHLCFRFSLLY
jgi:hypothetical protein